MAQEDAAGHCHWPVASEVAVVQGLAHRQELLVRDAEDEAVLVLC